MALLTLIALFLLNILLMSGVIFLPLNFLRSLYPPAWLAPAILLLIFVWCFGDDRTK